MAGLSVTGAGVTGALGATVTGTGVTLGAVVGTVVLVFGAPVFAGARHSIWGTAWCPSCTNPHSGSPCPSWPHR